MKSAIRPTAFGTAAKLLHGAQNRWLSKGHHKGWCQKSKVAPSLVGLIAIAVSHTISRIPSLDDQWTGDSTVNRIGVRGYTLSPTASRARFKVPALSLNEKAFALDDVVHFKTPI